MGTRHLICVVKNNEYKVVQYGHFDGNPDVEGLEILKFLKYKMKRDIFEKQLDKISYITENDIIEILKTEIENPEELSYVTDLSFELDLELDEYMDDFPMADMNISSEILDIIQNTNDPVIKLRNGINMGCGCEWFYIINLDNNTFSVYISFYTGYLKYKQYREKNYKMFKMPIDSEDFLDLVLIAEFNIDNLPSDEEFLNKCDIENKKWYAGY